VIQLFLQASIDPSIAPFSQNPLVQRKKISSIEQVLG